MPISTSENGWSMESYKEKKLHINGLEMKAESIAVRSMTKRKDTHSFENGQCNYGEVCQQDGGGNTHFNTNCKRFVGILSSKEISLTTDHLRFFNQTAHWKSRNMSTISTNSWRLNPQIFA